MANPFFQRLKILAGNEATEALERSRVIVFGLGGVGSWCAEALVRSGIGSISIVDSDEVCVSNVNRQIQALGSTLGRSKAEALEERLRDINPGCEIKAFPSQFSRETAETFDIPGADYVIDAIDTMPHKLDLIETVISRAPGAGPRLFSSMGMAQKIDPTLIKTANIWDTAGCPLARLVRQGLLKRDFSGNFTAVYSTEKPLQQAPDSSASTEPESGKKPLGSVVTVTAAAGMVLASLVVRDVYARFAPVGKRHE